MPRNSFGAASRTLPVAADAAHRTVARPLRRFVVTLALLAGDFGMGVAYEVRAGEAIPSFAELQDAGAVVGKITIDNQNIFDLSDPEENNFVFRTANTLHIKTRPEVIAQSLLFRTGDPVSVRLIEESERLLRCTASVYHVNIRPEAFHDGVVDIAVTTRDTWTLEPGIAFSRAGGSNSTGVSLEESNLFGTGISVGMAYTSTVDRAGTDFTFAYDHLFDGWTQIAYSIGSLDDGERQAFKLVRPFYSLDTRWSAGVLGNKGDQIESTYQAGNVVNQYRHKQESAEVFGGLSSGLVGRWTQRYSVGLNYLDEKFARDPFLLSPATLPPDQTLVSPFVRYELMEDDFHIMTNHKQIERAESVAMGLHAQAQLGRSLSELGSSRELWLYSAKVEKGFQIRAKDTLMTAATLSGQYGDGRVERQLLGGAAQYYLPHAGRAVFYSSLSGGALRNPQINDMIMLGGDNGLRGYPLRYQSGNQQALFTLEERVYTDWYPFRLFRVGGAVFYDVGRAWGGDFQNTANPGWLSDVGFGLRILSCRSAFGNVLHADIAFPLHGDSDIRSVQFLLRSKATF
ncbi:MAG: BamA/TamA family outer membrane protein [Burkholderiales bacterium]